MSVESVALLDGSTLSRSSDAASMFCSTDAWSCPSSGCSGVTVGSGVASVEAPSRISPASGGPVSLGGSLIDCVGVWLCSPGVGVTVCVGITVGVVSGVVEGDTSAVGVGVVSPVGVGCISSVGVGEACSVVGSGVGVCVSAGVTSCAKTWGGVIEKREELAVLA